MKYLSLVFITAFLFTFYTQTFAIDFTVNSIGGDGNCATSSEGCTTLQAVIGKANALSSNDRIFFNLPAAGNMTLQNVTVTQNSSNGDFGGSGGGIVQSVGTLTFSNTIVAGNTTRNASAPEIQFSGDTIIIGNLF